MAKRQERFIGEVLIKENFDKFSGKKVNIVLRNRSVLFAQPKVLKDDKLYFINMRLRESHVDLKDISEVIVDF